MSAINTEWQESFHLRKGLGVAEEIGSFTIDIKGDYEVMKFALELINLAATDLSGCTTWQDIDQLNDSLGSCIKRAGEEGYLRVKVLADDASPNELSFTARKIFFHPIKKQNYEIEIAMAKIDDLDKVERIVSKDILGKKNPLKLIASLKKEMGVDIKASLKPFTKRVVKEEEQKTLHHIVIAPPNHSEEPASSKEKDVVSGNLLSPRWVSKETRKK